MGLFQKLFTKRSNLTSVKRRNITDESQYIQNRFSGLNGTFSSFDFASPETNSTVFTCISVIANTVSKLPIGIYKTTDKGKELHTSHSWYNAIRYNPDLTLSTSKWLSYAITKMYLEGNSFFLRSDFDSNLTIKRQLKALGTVEAVVQNDGEIFYKFFNVEGWIPSKDLIHFYLLSKDGMIGLNPIESLRNEIDIQHGAEQVTKNFYKQGNFAILYIEPNFEAAKSTNDKFKLQEKAEQLEKDFKGYANAGRILVVPPSYNLKSLPLPDLKFLESSKFTISQIAALYQVPSFYVGVQEQSSSYGKAEQQQLAFLNVCLSNVCNIIRSELEQKILTIEERNQGISIDFDYSKLFTTDLETRAKYLQTLSQIGAITPNESRESFGFQKIDNEYMNYTCLQKQYVPVSKMGTIMIEAPKEGADSTDKEDSK